MGLRGKAWPEGGRLPRDLHCGHRSGVCGQGILIQGGITVRGTIIKSTLPHSARH